MAASVLLSSLPTEVLIRVFVFLATRDIRACQRVCRFIRDTVQASPMLQYVLELDTLGYTVPLNPRKDLSYAEKSKLLRTSKAKSTEDTPTPTRIDLEDTGFMLAKCEFARGVFVYGPTQDDRLLQKLVVYQFDSINENTPYESWNISVAQDMCAYKIDPDQDLLILLRGGPPDDHPNMITVRELHMCSLKSGNPHPLAVVPVITPTERILRSIKDNHFQIVGKYVALLTTDAAFPAEDSLKIFIWDWITGELVTMGSVIGDSFVFISESRFIVASGRDSPSEEAVGFLHVYEFDPARLGQEACCIASLHLPTTPGDPCCSSPQLVPSPHSLHSFHPAHSAPSLTRPRVYELSPNSHYVCILINVNKIQSYPYEVTRGLLFVPTARILEVTANHRRCVPWEQWAKGVYWINGHLLHCEPKNYIFGPRFAPLIYNYELDLFQIPVYHLGPSNRASIEDPLTMMLSKIENAHKYLDRLFLSSGHARRPLLISLITVPSDVLQTNRIRPEIMVDDEHIAVHSEDQLINYACIPFSL
ncbi:F-box-like protein [Ceratobasidium sp. AG-Ba]|nr:F-box-like protein [Ceratobasidium sp. AG-Ba]